MRDGCLRSLQQNNITNELLCIYLIAFMCVGVHLITVRVCPFNCLHLVISSLLYHSLTPGV